MPFTPYSTADADAMNKNRLQNQKEQAKREKVAANTVHQAMEKGEQDEKKLQNLFAEKAKNPKLEEDETAVKAANIVGVVATPILTIACPPVGAGLGCYLGVVNGLHEAEKLVADVSLGNKAKEIIKAKKAEKVEEAK